MNHLTQRLNEHYVNFPEMDVQDAVKFLYQHFVGPGHLVPDEAAARSRLLAEWDAVQPDKTAVLSHSLGGGLCRLNLSACKAIGLSPNTVSRIFFLTANHIKPDPQGLEQNLELVRALPFPRQEVDQYLSLYRSQGCPMVSHSETFRRRYSPAYRIVSEYYATFLPALAAIDRAAASQPRLRVAIDGPCASGKSTLGVALSEVYCCPLIHMDDFFLRPEQRTPQRLAQPGGNVDYERFSREVLTPLLAGSPIRYRPFLCHSRQLGVEITLAPAPITVVEGCYCLRPDLRDAFDVRIWAEASWTSRRQRLLERGGQECLARFEAQWIPLENAYFTQLQVCACCGVHLDLSDD